MRLPTVHAFWSYSRTTELQGTDALHAAMEASLEEAIAPMPLRIFRDSAANGLASGEDWRRGIVQAVARSTLLFWVQSPRWLHRPVCRLEFEAFRDRVRRAAAVLKPHDPQAAFEDLWSALVVPIRWLDVDEDQWRDVPDPARRALARDWQRMNVVPSLMLPEFRRRHQSAGSVYALACVDAAAAIRARVAAVFEAHQTSWRGWCDVLATDARAFEDAWLDEFSRRASEGGESSGQDAPAFGDLSLATRQAELARRYAGGKTRLERPELGLTLVLLPRDDDRMSAFWCASAPVANRHARTWARRFGTLFSAEPGAAGALTWSREAIEALRPALRDEGLDIPSVGEAAGLVKTLAVDRGAVHRLGLQSVPRGFWTVAADGALVTQSGAADRGELLLVAAAAQEAPRG
ncbi:hypothetical protein [Aquabacterium humicola]|uniref:hypothetical protein n=1 Tax=Aquabacterium humicola TaxID=3237377 RepID=UPI002542A3B3|nr:hypothetical protein [Rubrivivax pictus]